MLTGMAQQHVPTLLTPSNKPTLVIPLFVTAPLVTLMLYPLTAVMESCALLTHVTRPTELAHIFLTLASTIPTVRSILAITMPIPLMVACTLPLFANQLFAAQPHAMFILVACLHPSHAKLPTFQITVHLPLVMKLLDALTRLVSVC